MGERAETGRARILGRASLSWGRGAAGSVFGVK